MKKDVHVVENNNTQKFTTFPTGKKAIGVKWVSKKNYKSNTEMERFKARLIAKGCKQKLRLTVLRCFRLLLGLTLAIS